MLDSIKKLFSSAEAPVPSSDDGENEKDLSLAACALLLDLAYADEEFTEDERGHLEAAVRRHYGLEPDQAAQLIELAEQERAGAVDLWQFTSLVANNYSVGQKMVLAEIMWGLVSADGELVDREQQLMRKISSLLGLEPGYLALARKRAEDMGRG